MKKAAILLGLLLSSCSNEQMGRRPEQIVLPNGHQGYAIGCGNEIINNPDMNRCYREAGTVCPNGYSIAKGSAQEYAMIIECTPTK